MAIHGEGQDLQAIQSFAMNEYGVYIPMDDINAIVNKQSNKQGENLFNNLNDEDKIIFA